MAEDVDTEAVKKLQADGLVPIWYVSESYLEETYGQRGSPKPQRGERSQSQQRRETSTTTSSNTPTSDSFSVNSNSAALPSDIDFLKERIHTLEQEKREEVQRNEKREAKLFAELDVKNKQISAWDEITQGLTRALDFDACQVFGQSIF